MVFSSLIRIFAVSITKKEMKKKLLTILITLCVCSIPLMAVVNGQSLLNTLKDLCTELQEDYRERAEAQQHFDVDYGRQHQRMIDVITESDELSLRLYSQDLEMTFDLAHALKKVTENYNDFSTDRRPYDRIAEDLNIEIDRYARLIAALRRLPPMIKDMEIEILPDSLLYHNDSLDQHLYSTSSTLEKEVIRMATKDTLAAPFLLDSVGQALRDSCIFYALELLKMNAGNRATVIADSTHYQEAYWRLKETYDYAQMRFQAMQRYVFVEGQTPFIDILANPRYYWEKTKADLKDQYDFEDLDNDNGEKDKSYLENLSSRGEKALLVVVCCLQLVILALFWGLTFFVIWLLCRYTRLKHYLPKMKRTIISILTGTILYFLIFGFFWRGDELVQLGVRHINTFLWLLIAISGSLLLRVKPEQFRQGFQLYSATFFMALVIIVCRIIFIPDKLLVLLFPIILFIAILRQLFYSIRYHGKATQIDSTLGWVSLSIYILAFIFSFVGYTFVALLILVWWYFQLAVLLTIMCIYDLMIRYKKRWLDKRVDAMRDRITYVSGADRESLLFGTTWLYDLIRQVVIPAIVLISLPWCISLSLDIFDFDDMFLKFYYSPFIQLFDKDGFETLRISGNSIIWLLILFYALSYLSKAIHAIWRYIRYTAFMRKYNRTTIRDNEINLSLGNSIISVLIWIFFVVTVISIWKIPTGSLGLVAGGLSAGIGLALKDTLNNFIYGIQLMGGRLRVGDWIECEGVRGKVISINYQCVQVETIEGTEMSFLNSSLFGKNFNNLTRNHSYELIKIVVGVAYGTDINNVRQVLVEAMEKMRSTDRYGREIVDPKYGVNVVVDNMSDSAVDVAVKQYVLVAERIAYVDRAKEVVYQALTDAGITIAYPQCDVHLIHDN